ncbi:MAG TPA: hypothetical protein VFT62_08845 [Mycobacteriales bacterium]|nr:hypothetical protein [Mycobacteriales bacterium]
MSVRQWVVRHAGVVAAVPAVIMLASIVASVPAVVSLGLSLDDVVLWPAITAFICCGWLLAARRPANAVGWLLLMTAAGLNFLPWSVLSAWLLEHGVSAAKWSAGLSGASFVLNVGGLGLLLPLLFPDGRLPSQRRWWRIVLAADLGYMLFASVNLFQPGPVDLPGHVKVANPFGVHHKAVVGAVILCALPMLLIGFAGAFSAIVARWRQSDPAQRAQMKWVTASLVLAPVPFMVHDWWAAADNTVTLVAFPLVPITIAVSVLRYRLYEIDRIVSRAVSYLLVTGLLVGVYVGCVALLTSLLSFGSSVGVAASTLAAAALFQPLRRRVQHRVDRRFNREGYDAARTIDAFAGRLRDEIDPDLVRGDLLAVAASAIQPATVSLWVRA